LVRQRQPSGSEPAVARAEGIAQKIIPPKHSSIKKIIPKKHRPKTTQLKTKVTPKTKKCDRDTQGLVRQRQPSKASPQ